MPYRVAESAAFAIRGPQQRPVMGATLWIGVAVATKYTDRYRSLVTGILIALVACGGTARPHDAVNVATDAALPIPTAAPTNTLPPSPAYAPAPVEKAGSGTTCPDGYPIKADDDTKLYHRPGQQEYDVTNARHCFVSERTAQAAGYQASQV